MKALFATLFGIASVVGGASAEQIKPSGAPLYERPQICVERPENGGVLNVRPADVVIEDGPVLRLTGGEAACAFVEVGKHMIQVESKNPYDAGSLGWKSPPREVQTLIGSKVHLRVCAVSHDNGYAGWSIVEAAAACK